MTPLLEWLDTYGVSVYKLSRATGIHVMALHRIKWGVTLPSLIAALKIEKATAGKVDVHCWIKTPQGQARWNSRAKDIPQKKGNRLARPTED